MEQKTESTLISSTKPPGEVNQVHVSLANKAFDSAPEYEQENLIIIPDGPSESRFVQTTRNEVDGWLDDHATNDVMPSEMFVNEGGNLDNADKKFNGEILSITNSSGRSLSSKKSTSVSEGTDGFKLGTPLKTSTPTASKEELIIKTQSGESYLQSQQPRKSIDAAPEKEIQNVSPQRRMSDISSFEDLVREEEVKTERRKLKRASLVKAKRNSLRSEKAIQEAEAEASYYAHKEEFRQHRMREALLQQKTLLEAARGVAAVESYDTYKKTFWQQRKRDADTLQKQLQWINVDVSCIPHHGEIIGAEDSEAFYQKRKHQEKVLRWIENKKSASPLPITMIDAEAKALADAAVNSSYYYAGNSSYYYAHRETLQLQREEDARFQREAVAAAQLQADESFRIKKEIFRQKMKELSTAKKKKSPAWAENTTDQPVRLFKADLLSNTSPIANVATCESLPGSLNTRPNYEWVRKSRSTDSLRSELVHLQRSPLSQSLSGAKSVPKFSGTVIIPTNSQDSYDDYQFCVDDHHLDVHDLIKRLSLTAGSFDGQIINANGQNVQSVSIMLSPCDCGNIPSVKSGGNTIRITKNCCRTGTIQLFTDPLLTKTNSEDQKKMILKLKLIAKSQQAMLRDLSSQNTSLHDEVERLADNNAGLSKSSDYLQQMCKEISSVKAMLNASAKQDEELDGLVQLLQNAFDDINTEKEEYMRKLSVQSAENVDMATAYDSLYKEKQLLEISLDSSQKNVSVIESNMEALNIQLNDESERVAELSEENSQLKIAINSLEENLEASLESLKSLNKHFDGLEVELIELSKLRKYYKKNSFADLSLIEEQEAGGNIYALNVDHKLKIQELEEERQAQLNETLRLQEKLSLEISAKEALEKEFKLSQKHENDAAMAFGSITCTSSDPAVQG